MIDGLVTFSIGERVYATRLAEVREIVRLDGIAELPAMQPPLAGVLDLRGFPLPVLDIRVGESRERGDVLVLEPTGSAEPVGVAVDRVLAVNPDDVESAKGTTPTGSLPAYVVDVFRNAAGPVFLVDLRRMFALAAV